VTIAHTTSASESLDSFVVPFMFKIPSMSATQSSSLVPERSHSRGRLGHKAFGLAWFKAGQHLGLDCLFRLAASTRAPLRSNRRIGSLVFLPKHLLGRSFQHVVGKEELAVGGHHHHLNSVR